MEKITIECNVELAAEALVSVGYMQRSPGEDAAMRERLSRELRKLPEDVELPPNLSGQALVEHYLKDQLERIAGQHVRQKIAKNQEEAYAIEAAKPENKLFKD